MLNYSLALLFGAGFGFALNKAGLTKYHKIVNVFRFTDMAVLQFMMTALVVAMTGLFTLRGLGLLTFPRVPATYIVGNFPEDAARVALVGDALFAGSIGGMGGGGDAARAKIREQILSLPSDTLLCPGHGPLTTVAEEKEHNPFFG